jgi:hypothetical protein
MVVSTVMASTVGRIRARIASDRRERARAQHGVASRQSTSTCGSRHSPDPALPDRSTSSRAGAAGDRLGSSGRGTRVAGANASVVAISILLHRADDGPTVEVKIAIDNRYVLTKHVRIFDN